jgi:hypothetical protein
MEKKTKSSCQNFTKTLQNGEGPSLLTHRWWSHCRRAMTAICISQNQQNTAKQAGAKPFDASLVESLSMRPDGDMDVAKSTKQCKTRRGHGFLGRNGTIADYASKR